MEKKKAKDVCKDRGWGSGALSHFRLLDLAFNCRCQGSVWLKPKAKICIEKFSQVNGTYHPRTNFWSITELIRKMFLNGAITRSLWMTSFDCKAWARCNMDGLRGPFLLLALQCSSRTNPYIVESDTNRKWLLQSWRCDSPQNLCPNPASKPSAPRTESTAEGPQTCVLW